MANKLFLDVDGVLNADDHRLRWPDTDKKKVLINRGGGYRAAFTIRWSPTMVTELARIVTEHDVQVVWLTTWCEDLRVRKIEHALGWSPPGAAVAPFPPFDAESPHAWKRDAVLAGLDAGDVAVWVDDEAVPAHRAETLDRAEALGAHLLTLAPSVDPELGLTPDALDEIRNHF